MRRSRAAANIAVPNECRISLIHDSCRATSLASRGRSDGGGGARAAVDPRITDHLRLPRRPRPSLRRHAVEARPICRARAPAGRGGPGRAARPRRPIKGAPYWSARRPVPGDPAERRAHRLLRAGRHPQLPHHSRNMSRSRSTSSGIVAFAAFLAAYGAGRRLTSTGPDGPEQEGACHADEDITLRPRAGGADGDHRPVASAGETVGPGERRRRRPRRSRLPDAEIAKLKEGQIYRRPALAHLVRFRQRGDGGRQRHLQGYGVELVAETDAGFDPRQAAHAMSRPCSPRSRASSWRCRSIRSAPPPPSAGGRGRRQAGLPAPISPPGYAQAQDYVAIVTDDLYQMGKQAGDALAAAIGGKGKVAYIFHDAQYYVTNQRDQAFKATIENDPRTSTSSAARASPIRPAPRKSPMPSLTKTPDLDGIYCHLGRAGRGRAGRAPPGRKRTTKVVTLDLSSRSASTWSRAAMSRRSSPTRPMSSARHGDRRVAARQGGAALHRRPGAHSHEGRTSPTAGRRRSTASRRSRSPTRP